MAVITNNGDISLTTANAWRGFDAGGLVTSVGTTITVGTAYTTSPNFTLTNTKVTDGVLVTCAQSSSASGTFTVELFDGTNILATVTVNATSLPGTTGSQTSWVFFKWDATYTSTGLTTLAVRVKCSVANSVQMLGASSTSMAKRIRITDNATAAAADQLEICSELNSASGRVNRTVTMNSTATTIYGAVNVYSGATFAYGNTASTAYIFKTAGILTIDRGGTFTIGTSGASIPSTSTAELFFSNSTNVDFGLLVSDGGTFTTHATAKTKYQLLNADYASGTTITLDGTPTGWKNGDTLGFASTTLTNTQFESKTLGADVSTTSGTLSSGLANAHGGTSPVQAEVINLNRYVRIHGTSTSLQAYARFQDAAIISCTNSEFYNFGSNTINKRGIDIQTNTGSCALSGCSFHDFVVSGSQSGLITTDANHVTITDCVYYNISRGACEVSATTNTDITITGSVIIGAGVQGVNGIGLSDMGFTGGFSGHRISSCNGNGIGLNESSIPGFSISDCNIHSNAGDAISLTGQIIPTLSLSNCSLWRSNGSGINLNQYCDSWTIDTLTTFGNSTAGISIGSGGAMRSFVVKSWTSNAGVTLTQPVALSVSAGHVVDTIFESCSFGATTAHTTGDLSAGTVSFWDCDFRNCTFASTTEISGQTSMARGSRIGSSKHDGTVATHKTWRRYGTHSYDTTRYGTASPAVKITPNTAGSNYVWPIPMIACVDNGDTVTINVKVRKSNVTSADGFANDGATYNGSQPKLYVRANAAVGITSDTLIDTCTSAADGAFETLTGTTGTVTDDGALEFYVICDGTAGTIWVDDWSAT